MNRSESTANIASALVKAQTALKNPHFDSTNPHFKSKFASLAAVREAVVPVFSACGIAITQWPVATENGFAGCITRLDHTSGEWMEERFVLPVDRGNAHGYASCVTYAKRISMQSVAAVVGDEDDDGNAAVDAKKPSSISGAGVKQDAFDSLEPDEKTWLRDLAEAMTAMVAKGDAAGALIEFDTAIPQTGEKRLARADVYVPALQSLLDSKTRSALKAAREQMKKAA